MIALVVFIVLMILWLFGGGMYVFKGPTPDPMAFGSGTLIPWVCVAILGYQIFK